MKGKSMKPLEVSVGHVIRVEKPGTFTLGANKKGLLIWPDMDIRLAVVGGDLTPPPRRKIDRGVRRRSN